jgi:hypothetical protein
LVQFNCAYVDWLRHCIYLAREREDGLIEGK